MADLAVPPKPDYPPGVPDKFDPDGKVQPFAGNTVICALDKSTPLYESMLVLHDKLKKSSLSHLIALLPPSSWHMTVFEGVVDKRRDTGQWPKNVAQDATLKECTSQFKTELSTFKLQTKLPYRLSLVELRPFKSGITIQVEPRPEDNAALRDVRNRLADVLQIRQPNHERYVFHMSLAYLLRNLNKKQKAELTTLFTNHFKDMPKDFELGAPELCTFENMCAFKPVLRLKNRETEKKKTKT